MEKHRVLVGSGPNECSRLVRMAGPGQIVVSEDFVKGWELDVGAKVLVEKDLSPSSEKPPIGMQIKSGSQSYFRFYKSGSETSINAILRQVHRADQVLFRVIREIEDEFVEVITDHCPELTPKKISTRVSLFVFDRNNPKANRLVSTEYRYMRGRIEGGTHRDGSSVAKGATSYAVSGDTGPQGPIGQAFVRKTPIIVSNLPNYRKSVKDSSYVKVLAGEPWHIPEQTIHEFGRKARCFLAVPCWLHEGARVAEAVICIDTMHPLDCVSEQLLRDCATEFGRFFGTLIAALLWLRS